MDPAATPVLTPIDEDNTTSPGDTASQIVVDGSITDPDGPAVEAIAVTQVDNTHGMWQYSLNNGSTWTNFSPTHGSLVNIEHSALLLDPANNVRFVPDADYNGTATFTFRAWDRSSGVAGGTADASVNGGTTAFSTAFDTASITINAVNDAPVLDPGCVLGFHPVTEDDTGNPGDSVAALIGSAITDPDSGNVGAQVLQGIAVTGSGHTGSGNGHWQFSIDGGSTWNDVGAVSDSQAMLLRPEDKVRFVPDAMNGEIGSITFRAWDQTGATAGMQGTTADTSSPSHNGGITPFSLATAASAITVSNVNDAPVLLDTVVVLNTIPEDPGFPSWRWRLRSVHWLTLFRLPAARTT